VALKIYKFGQDYEQTVIKKLTFGDIFAVVMWA